MRRSTLSLTLLLFTFIGYAQQTRVPSSKEILKDLPNEVLRLDNTKSLKDIAAIGDTIFYEDFSNGLTYWSTYDINNPSGIFIWEYTNIGPDGPYAGINNDLRSTSSENGWAIFDSDKYLTGAYNSVLISPPINLSSYPDVILSFEEYYRRWYGDIFIAVSTDQVTWYEQEIHGDFATKETTDNPNLYYWNVSNYIGGHSTAFIRFRMTGDWDYYWQIDDIAILESPTDDLVLRKCLANTFDTTGAYFSKITRDQLSTIHLGGEIENFGSVSQTDAKLAVSITNGVETFFDDHKISVGDWPSGVKDTIRLDAIFDAQTLEIGNYTIDYNLSSNEVDLQPQNNSLSVGFQVTDTVLAHYIERTTSVSLQSYNNTSPGDFIGCLFHLPNTDTVSSVSVFIDSSTSPGVIIAPEVHLYDETVENFVLRASGEEYLLTESDIGKWITLNVFSQDGISHILEGDNEYGAGIACFWTPGETIMIGADGSKSYLHNDSKENALLVEFVSSWYNGATPMVTMNMKRTAPIIYPPLFATISDSVNIRCKGDTNGSATVYANGGNLDYTYLWSDTDNQTGTTASNLAAGTYTVTITDGHGTTATASVMISEPAEYLIHSVDITDYTCPVPEGSAELVISGGLQPYDFEWSSGDSVSLISGLEAGIYSYTITDFGGCVITDYIEVLGLPEPMTIAIAGWSNVSLFGESDGTIDINVNFGKEPYTYLWSTGDTTANISGLYSGIYTAAITDANLCSDSVSVVITEPDPVCDLVSTDSVIANVSCSGGSDGSAIVNANSSFLPLNYLWSAGSITDSLATGLSAGTYTVTVTDAVMCIDYVDIVVTEPAAISLTGTAVEETGSGNTDGTIDVNTSGGTGSYTYLWSNSQTTEDLTGLTSGWYHLSVTDSLGCMDSTTFFVSLNDPTCDIVISATVTDVSCNNYTDGEITVSVSGGTPPFSYEWSNGHDSDTATGLAADNYILVVTDSRVVPTACIAYLDTIINQPDAIIITIDSAFISSYENSDGSVYLSVTGTSGPYTFIWDDDSLSTTEDITGLASGDYNVTVTDANSCSSTQLISIGEDSPDCTQLQLSDTIVDVTCFDDADGQIILDAYSPFSESFTYLWQNALTSSIITDLTIGDYTVSATDSVGCTIAQTLTINNPVSPLLSTIDVTDAICIGSVSGSIDITVSGGWYPYEYNWNTGDSVQDIAGLLAGSYSIEIIDSLGCITQYNTITVGQPESGMIITKQVTDVSSCTSSDGSITINVANGFEPYSYLWSTGETTSSITNLLMGYYSFVVEDSLGCKSNGFAELTLSEAPTTTAIITDETSVLSDGEIDITVYGGTSPFIFSWTGPSGFNSSDEDITTLAPGSYMVEITDSNQCVGTETFYVVPYNPECLNFEITPYYVNDYSLLTCNGYSDASLGVDVLGATGPVTYLWNDFNEQTTSVATGLNAGYYTVFVKDSIGCIGFDGLEIFEAEPFVVTLTVTDLSGPFSDDGTAEVFAIGGITPYAYIWADNATGTYVTGLEEGIVSVTVIDDLGCLFVLTDTIFTGIDEVNELSDIKIYPNPTNGVLTLINARNSNVIVYNVFGEIVAIRENTSERFTIDLSNNSSGTYLVSIQKGDALITRRIILTK